MLNFNDFLRTRAGSAYVRECVKCGMDIRDAVDGCGRDLYQVDIQTRWSRVCVHTGFLYDVLLSMNNLCFGTCVIRKYDRDAREYKVVYDGVTDALYMWFTSCVLPKQSVLIKFVPATFESTVVYDMRSPILNDGVGAVADAANHHAQVLCFFHYNMDNPLFRADAGFMMDWNYRQLPF